MVTSDNKFAKLAVPPREKRGSSAATLKSNLSMLPLLYWRASSLAGAGGGEPALAAAELAIGVSALAAALSNSGQPAQCGQCRRSRKPGWVATQVVASPWRCRRRRSDLIAFSAIIWRRRQEETRNEREFLHRLAPWAGFEGTPGQVIFGATRFENRLEVRR